MNILGISAFYHDSAACIVVDGRIVAAAQEERFSRIRHDKSFPYLAVRFCLERAGLAPEALDRVVFYEKPLIKLERVLQNAIDTAPRGIVPFAVGMPSWFTEKLRLPRIMKREFGYAGPIEYSGHHESHAASAFFPSPFQHAAILTVDGVGEWTTNAIAAGHDGTIEMLREINYPDSLGLLYSAFTEFLGFKVNSDEYKVMGLAPYGEPRFVDVILDRLVDVAEDGSYRLGMEYLDFRRGRRTAGERFGELFGCAARAPESAILPVHMDIARSIQEVTDLVMMRQASFARRITGLDRLCLAGGVALNCVANGRILAGRIFDEIWIQPAAGDAGGALGAALACWHRNSGSTRVAEPDDSMQGALLGPEYTDKDIVSAMAEAGLDVTDFRAGIHDEIARRVASGQVVARFSGRMEFGPRALGSRSILADPRNPAMQRVVNEKIKFREGFRPFAPAVLEDRAGEWFDLRTPGPYMLVVSQVSRQRMLATEAPEPSGLDRLKVNRSQIPAVTHVDWSARIQTVSASRSPDFTQILEAFDRLTGCPVLLNTSFNLRGQPIVCTPAEAVATFLACDIDALAAGPFLATKPAGWKRLGLPAVKPFRRPRRTGELRRFGFENAAAAAIAGAAAWLWPERPLAWLAGALWLLSAAAVGTALLGPGLLTGMESVMHRAGAKLNNAIGVLLFGLIHVLVVMPTKLLSWKTRRRPGAGPEWTTPAPDNTRGGPENMY